MFAMFLLFLTVAILSSGELKEPSWKLARQLIHWLTFTIFGSPNLNSYPSTSVIVAGVTWTLPYEWFFYLSLPLLSLLIRSGARPPRSFLLLSGIATLIAVLKIGSHPNIWMYFIGGIVAAFLVRHETFKQHAIKPPTAIIAIGCISMAVVLFPTAFNFSAWLLLSIAFIPIACGNTLFGLLITPASRMLGQIAYSIYLLHGLLLFWSFNFILGIPNAANRSPAEYWFVIITLTPILVLGAFITFRLIENPAMQVAKNWKLRF
jgi:peptidoglycan/LPS O-acetylase OafA/YrhL